MSAKEIDLLASHNLDHSHADLHHQAARDKLLVWKKLVPTGFLPSARIGHSSVAMGYGAVVFGGVEAGQRVNSLMYLDVINNSCNLLPCKGDIPSPRCYHAACGLEELMIIHGGEGLQTVDAHTRQSSDTGVEDSLSQATIGAEGTEAPKYRVGQPMDGICPGDSIQPTKIGASAKKNIATTPGDTIATSGGGADASRAVLRSLDDMYALDCTTLTWVRIQCTLGPLPRKGHTLNMCRVYGKESLLLACGYSLETAIVSNSILVCEAAAVSKYVHQVLSMARGPSPHTARAPSSDEPLRPVVWRSLQTKGSLPVGRYRHTTSVVSTAKEELLVMIGGIGKDATSALSDVHILNLGSLCWVRLHTNLGPEAAASRLTSGEGPFQGVFGHVAFPVRKAGESAHAVEQDAWRGAEEFEIIIFGGSSNPADTAAHGYHSLFAFDLEGHDWRRVMTGPQFPASRCFHSSACIPNWSPFHELPFVQSSLKRRDQSGSQTQTLKRINSSTIGIVAKVENLDANEVDEEHDFYLDLHAADGSTPTSGTIIIFGGMNLHTPSAEAWLLDLQWRSAGLDQFDDTMAQRLREQMLETFPEMSFPPESETSQGLSRIPFSASRLMASGSNPSEPTSRIVTANNAKYLSRSLPGPMSKIRTSASEPFLATSVAEGPSKTNKMKLLHHISLASNQADRTDWHPSRTGDGDRSDGEDRDEREIHKIRKERALADLMVKEEKERLLSAERRVELLIAENNALKADYESQLAAKCTEIDRLKELLTQSVEREAKLVSLNTEAYQLLGLHGLQNL